MSKERVPADLRRQVGERARGCCEYCRSQAAFATESFSVEHIIPHSAGGATISENLALACQGCNGHKSDKTLGYDSVTGNSVPLFDPRRQRWADHFVWDDTFTLIEGVTPTGRATVYELHLNRPGLRNLRRALRALGEHPPAEV
jgi:hypothetical protein